MAYCQCILSSLLYTVSLSFFSFSLSFVLRECIVHLCTRFDIASDVFYLRLQRTRIRLRARTKKRVHVQSGREATTVVCVREEPPNPFQRYNRDPWTIVKSSTRPTKVIVNGGRALRKSTKQCWWCANILVDWVISRAIILVYRAAKSDIKNALYGNQCKITVSYLYFFRDTCFLYWNNLMIYHSFNKFMQTFWY